MAKFIIFTNNDNACFPNGNNPFIIMDLNHFGMNGNIVVIGTENTGQAANSVLVNTPNQFDFSSYDILIHVDIIPEREIIENFVNGDTDVYVLLHSGIDNNDVKRRNNQKDVIRAVLGDDFENFIEQSHDDKSIYWNELIEIARCVSKQTCSIDEYNQLLGSLRALWPNPYLESLIRLYKSLGLIPLLKLDPGQRIQELKDKESYKLAFELFKKRDVKGNVEDHEPSLDELLKWTVQKIPELSEKL